MPKDSVWWEIINTLSISFSYSEISFSIWLEAVLSKLSKISSSTKIFELKFKYKLSISRIANWIIRSILRYSPPDKQENILLS
jgi:hypothetical protein